jgi:hypothetical protein
MILFHRVNFIYSLIENVVTQTTDLQESNGWMMMNKELEGCARKGSWPDSKLLSWNLPGGTEENIERHQSG